MTVTADQNDAPRPTTHVHLRLLATSDLHMHLLPYDYHADAPSDAVGLSRVASLIAEARAEVPGALLLDNGDFLQGTPLGDHAAAQAASAGGHPMIGAMNALGYDAVTLGNHEFDFGLEVLEAALADARFPVVSANALRRRGAAPLEDVGLVLPRVILKRRLSDGAGHLHDIRIGVLGVLPPQVVHWDRERLEGRIEVRCMIDAARAHVAALCDEGADVVILLAHCGPSDRPVQAGMENALVPLAGIEGVDALVAGHVHRLIPGPHFTGLPGLDAEAGRVQGKPVVMPGIAGSHLGVLDLWLAPDAEGWRPAAAHTALRPIARRGAHGPEPLVEDAPEVVAEVAKAHAATLASMRRPIGRSEIALHSFTSFAAPCPVIHAINAAQRWYVTQALGPVAEPVLAAAAPFKTGGPSGAEAFTNIAAGTLSYRDLSALYPFPNTLRAIRVTGAELRDWLERAAAAFNRIVPGAANQALLNPAFPGYDFDVIAGIEWQLDLSCPALWSHDGLPLGPGPGRVRGLRHGGEAVEDDDRFIVATNSYRIGGTGLYAPLAEAEVVLSEQIQNREVLARYLAQKASFDGPVAECWRFAPMDGATVHFDSGRGVLHHLPGIRAEGGEAMEPAGLTTDGFQRLRLTI
ncbi:bifunctional 2',3'-cyclic-nucleotide 2'-phosphodiesterase/3'-nucleotidase [Oceanicola sp. 502str15]|uniref:bifunctional 2',3'-cyclic-nucleotide 2'-phosphodiesterase/3'-nucleotidase n=1 Tax=Oceanicola sp. 502str15 TaxID=2696061 RepID=UPI0020943186|nr:bifunctional 2',3'-cyclic-nucleotide 2'-phosphodiesterase/3'-nucleotidase [Oceanicola sp. 502str15]MCO6383900.1 bifunctional 2',3'-cyclic-nucleotide 2'-phosphodiesterase/3'-nucleotidase [Oceanicola sp. 502str15]